ncbi:MAG: antibiotic biosynthesis monooxygenase [Sneathiella sp.]|nr:antibiotic biosynthesis monooxygenase [Sneathiella sp.]
MIAVIFEVEPYAEHKQQYLEIAADLATMLRKIEGFISVERFQSLTNEGKILSLSFFENEQAVEQWRQLEEHRNAQSIGRDMLFENYRLRVVQVLRDYGKQEREQAPDDSRKIHEK